MVTRISIFMIFVSVLYSLVYCDKQDNPDRIIAEIDTVELASRHLADFILLRERYIDSLRIESAFKRESDSVLVFLTIGIYKSETVADSTANEYVKFQSVAMNEGPHLGVSIGDTFWWYPSDADSNGLTYIVFIRKNTFITLSCSHDYDSLKALAKSIDDDIVNEETYIEFKI